MSCIFKLEQSDFETLLGLSESARHSLLWILSQFNYNHNGTLDRSQLDPAALQKLKRGIAELKAVGLLTKNRGTKNRFSLNTSKLTLLPAKPTAEQMLVQSGLYDTTSPLMDVLLAIETFLYDFDHTPEQFIVKNKMQWLLPRVYFQNMVNYARVTTSWDSWYWQSDLQKLKLLADRIKAEIAIEQHGVRYIHNPDEIITSFHDLIDENNSDAYGAYPHCKRESIQFRKNLRQWVNKNRPQLLF